MEQQRLQRRDLEPYLGSRHRVSEVLNRKRGLSLNMIRKLDQGLGIPLDALVGNAAYGTLLERCLRRHCAHPLLQRIWHISQAPLSIVRLLENTLRPMLRPMPSRKPNNSIPGRTAKAKPPNASRTTTNDALVPGERRVRLFRNGRNQALRIPREFELDGDEAILRREGNRLIIEPAPTESLLSLLAGWEPIDLPLPDIDEDLPPLDDPVIT